MLNLIFQKAKTNAEVWVDSREFFNDHFKNDWFESELAKELLEKIDHAKYIGDGIIQTESRKIVPEMLCTGTKTALCIYFYPDKVFNLTQMGDNVLDVLLKYIVDSDRTLLTYRLLHFMNVPFTKDGKTLDFDQKDLDEYWDHFDEWLEEMYND